MRILQIIPSLRKGGAERLCLDICNEISTRSGFQVKLVVFRDNNEYEELIRNFECITIPSQVKLSFPGKKDANTVALRAFINSYQPDIIHSHLFEAEIVSREKTFDGIKYFTHCHDNMRQFRNLSINSLFKKQMLTDFFEKQYLVSRYLRCNNNFIAISGDIKNYFQKALPKKLSKNISLLNNAIDFKRFNSINTERDLAKIRIVNVGSFIPLKNQQLLLAIAEQLIKKGMAVEIELLGAGPLYDEVKNKLVERNLLQVVSMPGRTNNIEREYAKANVYVHTSISEGFGLVIIEAMASGLPVVALDSKGNRGLVKDGLNGYFIHEQNAALFAEKIVALISNKQLYKEQSKNAVEFARGFDIGLYVDKLIDIYNR